MPNSLSARAAKLLHREATNHTIFTKGEIYRSALRTNKIVLREVVIAVLCDMLKTVAKIDDLL